MRQTWIGETTTFDCDLTSMRSFVGTVTISHISGYNARTLVNNLQMPGAWDSTNKAPIMARDS